MSTRSRVALTFLLVTVVGCSPTAGASGPPASQATQAAVAGTAAPTRPPATPRPTPRVGAFPNADGSVWVGVPASLGFVQPGEDGIWGILERAGVGRDIVRIDPQTYEVETIVRGLPIRPDPVAPISLNGSIWLVSDVAGRVTQYDDATGERIREIEVGKVPIEPVAAYGDVWTINHHGESITRIDSATGEAYPPIKLPGSLPLTITVVADDLMLVNGPDGSPTTWMVDPKRMKLIGTYATTECLREYGFIGVAIDGLVWRQHCPPDLTITITDPRTGKALESFASPVAPYPPLRVDGTPWLPLVDGVEEGRVGLAALDPDTHEVVGTYEQAADIPKDDGWWIAAFESWWRWGSKGLLRIPADTLRDALP